MISFWEAVSCHLTVDAFLTKFSMGYLLLQVKYIMFITSHSLSVAFILHLCESVLSIEKEE